jgi:hypothetical protein
MTTGAVMTSDDVARWWVFAPDNSIATHSDSVSAAIWRFEGSVYDLEGHADENTDVISMPIAGHHHHTYFADGRQKWARRHPPFHMNLVAAGEKPRGVSAPARHESTMTMDGQFIADQPQSYLVTTAEGARIFCGGDNSLSEDLLTWGALYEPQVAVLPPAEAATAARWLGVSTVIPVHYQPGDPAPTQLAADWLRRTPASRSRSWTSVTPGPRPERALTSR